MKKLHSVSLIGDLCVGCTTCSKGCPTQAIRVRGGKATIYDIRWSLIDLLETYKVVIKTHDYPMALKVKEPYKNQWKDENGDEEYIPASGLYFEAFTFTMECVMFSRGNTEDEAIQDLNGGVRSFRTFLSHGLFKTYDSWTGFGFQKVRLSQFPMPSDGSFDVFRTRMGSTTTEYARVIFTVEFKVNDPITPMVLSGGAIVQG